MGLTIEPYAKIGLPANIGGREIADVLGDEFVAFMLTIQIHGNQIVFFSFISLFIHNLLLVHHFMHPKQPTNHLMLHLIPVIEHFLGILQFKRRMNWRFMPFIISLQRDKHIYYMKYIFYTGFKYISYSYMSIYPKYLT